MRTFTGIRPNSAADDAFDRAVCDLAIWTADVLATYAADVDALYAGAAMPTARATARSA